MKGLMLHCGGQLRTREEVFAVAPPPETDSYVPLPYESFITRIEKQIQVEGIKITEERFALAQNRQRLFGLIHLELPGFGEHDFGCVLGFRNSYDKSCSTGICIGATVFVCDNLSFHGAQLTFLRKHTVNLMRDLSWAITQAVAALPAQFSEQCATFERYRSTELTDERAHHLAIRLYDDDAINLTQIPSLLAEWRSPRHPEFAAGGKTAWRLFNATTEAIKGDLWRLPSRTRILHRLLDSECEQTDGDVLDQACAEPAIVI